MILSRCYNKSSHYVQSCPIKTDFYLCFGEDSELASSKLFHDARLIKNKPSPSLSMWLKRVQKTNNNKKFCLNFVKSTLRVPVGRSGQKWYHFLCLVLGYITVSRNL